MKWIIASDIHGSESSCKKLLEAFENHKADRILLLGDLLYHGPRNALPEEYDTMSVSAQLNRYADKIICVKGNCDAEVDQMVLEFPITADYMQLPIEGKIFFASHGHHFSPDCLPPIGIADILISGHTHVPLCREYSGMLCLNPGSTSIPKGGSCKSYMLMDGKHIEWRHLDDDRIYMEHDF